MSGLDLPLLAEKTAAIEQHLARVAECLPKDPGQFRPMTAESDGVILHLWQAVQSVIDLALAACLYLHLGTPPSYGEAFERLAERGYLDEPLAQRLVRAAGFRNVKSASTRTQSGRPSSSLRMSESIRAFSSTGVAGSTDSST